MRRARLDDMIGGWFVGDFSPVVIPTVHAEVAVKRYRSGDVEPRHEHRVATEVTLVVEGSVAMNDEVLGPGDMLVVEPGEAVDFRALEDSVTVVVKTPSVADDKFLA